MHLDIFRGDAFSVSQLTLSMNNLPHQPGQIGRAGLFSAQGISTTTVDIERRGTTLDLVPAAARGSNRGKTVSNDKRDMLPFKVVHLPQSGAVVADEVQNLRAFGSESETETAQTLVNQKLAKMKRNIDATLEYHKIGAIKGQVLDADGTTVLLDIFNQFGVSQNEADWALSVDATKVKQLCLDLQRNVENELGGLSYTSIMVWCSPEFFDALVQHPAVEKAYDRYLDGALLRASQRSAGAGGEITSGFVFCDIQFAEYRGTVNGHRFIAAGEAYAVPMGVADLFIARFAPADYMETVNTIGVPYYAKSKMMDYDKGVEFEGQSNPLHLCTRPRAVVKLVKT